MTCTAAPKARERTAGPMRTGKASAGPGRQGGFTLMGLLFLVAILGVGLAALGKVWETAARRDREAELLFVGDQYRRALESYHRATPGQEKHYPRDLKELLLDPRFPNTVRHLRRLYRDPVGHGGEWGLVREGGEITGIHSLSTDTPLKTAGFNRPYDVFAGTTAYRDWVFLPAKDTTTPSREQPKGDSQGGAAVGRKPTSTQP